MYINGHYYYDEVINETSIFGEPIDANKLQDEKYVKELTKKIKETPAEEYKNRKKKQELFSLLSFISIIGIYTFPLFILFEAICKQIQEVDSTEKELDHLKKIIDNQINVVKYNKKLSKEEKDKLISKLEKNRDSIKSKQAIVKNNKSNDYINGSIYITKDISILSLTGVLIDNSCSIEDAIKDIENMKKNKSKYPNGDFNDYIEEVAIFGYDNESKLLKYLDNNKSKASYYINLYQIDDDDRPLAKKVYNQLKEKTVSHIISFESDYTLLYCYEDKYCYYFSPKYADVFAKCTLSQFVKAVNKSYKNLLKIIKDADIKESYIEDDIINEDAMLIAGSILMTIIFGQEIADKIKKIKADKKYTYIVSDKEIKKIPNYGFEDEKVALSWYAYDHLGIKNAEKGTLIYNSKSILNKNVYLYKFNKSDIKLVYNGPFDELCKKYNIKMKPMDESKLKDRDKVYRQTVSLVKQELNKYKELKSKARLEPDGKEYYDKFINGIDDSIGILYCDIWDIVPNARSNDDKDIEHANKIAYEPIQNIIKVVNTKLPKNYKVDSYGDWDDLDISLTYTGKLNESYTPYKGGVNVNTINNIANIARKYGITESGNLRDDIVSEYTDIIESLNTIDESVIKHDISLLPVYKINEFIDIFEKGHFDEYKEENDNNQIEESTKIKDNMPKKCTKCGSTNIGVFFKGEPIYQCKDCGQYLGTVPFPSKKNESAIEEGYAIDLESLKYVVESKQITLEEAVQEIRDVNYIGDTIPMYCILPKNINENMSLESFITLSKSLNEAGLIPVSIREYSEDEFITEGLTIETWSEPKVRKTLDKYEETLKELKKKKEDFQKMSDKEQKKYCAEKAIKNIVIGTIISIPTLFLGGAVYNTYTTMKGDNTILGPKNYIAGLNNLIAAYKVDINRLNKRLKELEKGKK